MAQCLTFYTYCSSLGVNCYLYTDPKRTITVGAGWVADGNTNWTVNSAGMITGTAACNVTDPDWTIVFGSFQCSGCDKYYEEMDLNPYSPTYNQVRRSNLLVESNSTFCGGCCGQSTAADWTIIFGSYGCSGCDKYYMEYDANPCSATYNQQRVSNALAEANSTYCCSAPTCNFYQMNSSGYVDFRDCSGTSQYIYYEWYDGFCADTLFSGDAYITQTCLN